MSKKAIEKNFPFIEIDQVAEKESYRKEVNRPIYYLHKWWAKRIGSIFRAINLGAILDEKQDIWEVFYKKHNLNNAIVLDPFMGSGTTIGEALKLGCKAIGCDINPVSRFIVEQSLKSIDPHTLKEEYQKLEQRVLPQISKYYTKKHPVTGEDCTVLYFFWAKVVTTPEGKEIPLFSNYVFSKNAYPKKKPQAQIICPNCYGINQARYDTDQLECYKCHKTFNPQKGPVQGQHIHDSENGQKYKILDLVKSQNTPPDHKLYACMILTPEGKKEYLEIDQSDLEIYQQASEELEKRGFKLAEYEVEPGYNANQAINYNYTQWKHFFNDRQLLSLGILLEEVLNIEDKSIREKFLCLFSGVLEFNNMFCSFKGEGTGAVRHIFYNHILKPERTPLENFPWGTSKSSGTFSSLFKTRLLRSQQYLEQPFELSTDHNGSSKKYCNEPLKAQFVTSYEALEQTDGSCLLLNGDSSNLPLPDECVDAVITDPPYFDFIHYSELADFFYAWLAPAIGANYEYFKGEHSRREGEVQNRDKDIFSQNLGKVLKEANRVLKKEGVLAFTFHHSKKEGWGAIYDAVHNAGLTIERAYPVKAEMSVSAPKSLSKSPINLDSIIVCKKQVDSKPILLDELIEQGLKSYKDIINRYRGISRKLSDADELVIFMSELLSLASKHHGQIFNAQNVNLDFEAVLDVAIEKKKATSVIPFVPKDHLSPKGVEANELRSSRM